MQKIITSKTAAPTLGDTLKAKLRHTKFATEPVRKIVAAAPMSKFARQWGEPASATIIKPVKTSTAPLGSGPAPLPAKEDMPGRDLSGADPRSLVDPAHRALFVAEDPRADLFRQQKAARAHVLALIEAAKQPEAARAFGQTLLREGGTG